MFSRSESGQTKHERQDNMEKHKLPELCQGGVAGAMGLVEETEEGKKDIKKSKATLVLYPEAWAAFASFDHRICRRVSRWACLEVGSSQRSRAWAR